MKFIRHIVSDMDESLIQRCLICGKEICNYQGASWPMGQNPPKGFPAGYVYVSDGNPTHYDTMEPKEEYETCKQ